MVKRDFWLLGVLLTVCLAAAAASAQSPYDDVLVAQGLKNLQLENYDEALADLKIAWEKGAKTAEKAFYLGVVSYRLADYPQSLEFMEEALRLDPQFNEARLQLAAIFLALNRPEEALPHLQELEAVPYKLPQTSMYLGQAALKRKQYELAVRYFRQAEEDPNLAQEAKLQASTAMAAQNQFKDAKQVLTEAISLNPGTREAGFAQRYMEAMDRRIKETKPLRLHLGASFDYDSNVSLEPGDLNVANIVPLGRGDTVFTQFGTVEYEFLPTGPIGVMASYNLFETFHRRLTIYDVMSHTLGITPCYRGTTGTFWLPFRYNYTDLASDKYWTSYILTPTYLHMLKPNLGLEAGLRWTRNYYWWFQPFPQEDRSSQNYGGSLGLYYFLKKKEGYLQARFSYEYYDASGSNWTSSIYRLLLGGFYPVTEKFRINPTLEFVYQPFDHQWFNGVDYLAKRRDKTMIFGLQMFYKIYAGLDLNLHYYYIRDDSNIPLYDYDRSIVGAMIEYRY
ncbi:tetratricopeptide repeat protein [Desulfobacca acetoxidans]